MPPKPDARQLEWVSLTDFTPGIYQRSERVLGNNAIPAPLGAAQVTNTYRCQALPTGGLAPLPSRTAAWNIPSPDVGWPTTSNVVFINGLYAFGPLNPAVQYTDEVLVGLEYIYTGPQRRWRLYQLQFYNNPSVPNSFLSANQTAISSYNSTAASPSTTKYWGSSFASSRISATTDYTQPGVPLVVWDWTDSELGGTKSFVQTFPSATAANSTAAALLGNNQAQVIGHQGRIVLLQSQNFSHGPTEATSTNEQINFTDPPGSPTIGTQNEVFSQENPVGYGAWGSISAGELFLVKQEGGGVVVSGDVANPSITRLPGVISTGGLICRAVSTPQGLFYAANRVGVCVWRGGDTSDLVSEQLDGDFFRTTYSNTYTEGTFLNGVSVSLESWGTWVVTSNNWLYNTITRSWWRLEDTSVATMAWYARSYDPRYMWGATGTFTSTSTPVVHVWDMLTPSPTYSWQSHPIPASIDRIIEVRDMVASIQGSGTVTVTLTALDGTTQTATFTASSSTQPQRLRPQAGWQATSPFKGYNVVVRIQSDGGSGAAPIVHSLQLGTRSSQPAVAS